MTGTTLVRESPPPGRAGPSRAVAPPVLIEVPTLPGSRRRRPRLVPRRRVVAAGPRRRLRREVRLVGAAGLIGALIASSTLALRDRAPSPAGGAAGGGGEAVAVPFAIELDHPIPVPADSIELPAPIEAPPVAFPGYLLPGDGDEGRGHARP